jgi:FMN phosphatase YigB (HAD superfamily)
MKPDSGAYVHALNELQVRATDVYFFDDLVPNVAAARNVGINAFHVSEFQSLAPLLRAEGLYHLQTPKPPVNADAKVPPN